MRSGSPSTGEATSVAPVDDATTPERLRVVIAGGRRLLRDALQALLSADPTIAVVAAVDEVLAAEAAVARHDARVVVTHAHLGTPGGGIVLADRLRQERPPVGVVLLLGDGDAGEVGVVLEHGTSGRALLMMDHHRSAADLPMAVHEVARGGSMIHPDVVELVLRARRPATDLVRLTAGELAVLREIALGRSNVSIATTLGLSGRAVEKRIGVLYDKLALPTGPEVHRRVLAALVARQRGLVD